MSHSKHALVFGASGISGWGTIVQLVSYPTKFTFSSITGLTNRPLSKEDSLLPEDDRIQLISGVDLNGTPESVIQALTAKVPHIAEITTVFFYAYVNAPEGESVRTANTRLVENALLALDVLSPKLEHFILQTGGKTYGVLHNSPLPPQPFKESDARSKYKELLDDIFYYPQVDAVKRHSEASNWSWSETIPDAIIGFAPTSNAINMGRGIAVYFLMWRKIHGEGSEVPFVGGTGGWEAATNLSSMSSTARLAIHLALNSAKTNGKSYNITERKSYWRIHWPLLAKEFGLVGVPPAQDAPVAVQKWAQEHKAVWDEIVAEHNLQKGSTIEGSSLDIVEGMLSLSRDREYDNTERINAGFDEDIDILKAFKEAWTDFARYKILPPV